MSEATTAAGTEAGSERAEPGLAGMILRDLAIVFAVLSLWAAADTWYVVTGLWLAQVVAVGDAILIGLLLAAVAHEWGHYSGAMLTGAKAWRRRSKGLSLLRFNFDYAANDHRQFHWMTYGGHLFHWVLLLLLVIALPLDSLGRIALVGSVFGFVVFATVIEFNILRDTWAGADPDARVKAITRRDFQQSIFVGSLAGLFAIAALA